VAPDVDAYLDREQEAELSRAEGHLVREKFFRRAVGESTETIVSRRRRSRRRRTRPISIINGVR